MKYKLKKKVIISSIIVLAILVSIQLLSKNTKVDETTYINKNTELIHVNSYTVTELIRKNINKEQRGPIPQLKKIAYITIDDGPSKYTNEILDILEQHNVKATFFMVNNNMEKHPDEVQRIEKEGHGVGFHSVTHDIKKLYKNEQATLQEFETCKETYFNLTGEMSKLIRLPYGSKPYMPDKSYEILNKYDYKIWDWNLDTQDWRSTSDSIVSNILCYGRNKNELIILMHEKEQSVNALDNIIKILREREYEIRPLTEDVEGKNFWKGNL